MQSEFLSPGWVHSTNIYEVNLRQYTAEGTFKAFANFLPGLKNIGVQTLWFMPVHPIGKVKRIGTLGSYYSISDHKAVNPEFGTLEDFKDLINLAHSMGFRIMMDWVANHTSWDHVWTGGHPEFYVRDSHGNFQSPYDWQDVIQIDHSSDGEQEAMMDAMQFWVEECAIDGFRCDMAHLTPLSFWRKARQRLDQIKSLFWLGETEEPSYHEVFDASYTWELLHTMEAYWRGEKNMSGLESVLIKYLTLFPATAIRLLFTSNHDENSHSGSEYERLGDAALPFAVLCATFAGIPLVYSGQELPLKKRLDFFNKDAIGWTGKNLLDDFYKILLGLHAGHPAMRGGDPSVQIFRIKTTQDENILSYLRKNGESEVLVILNLSAKDNLHFELRSENVSGRFQNVFSGGFDDLDDSSSFNMKSWSYLVYQK
ncbi:MAG: 1,4-alpha-glucan branching protein [Sphingobacteriales bacterium UTBCD1]|jgi:glycosidase|nr:MAG: 1,4-alpha-glucan branching protein [Sphingobacteriales bacterium UTBCD1]